VGGSLELGGVGGSGGGDQSPLQATPQRGEKYEVGWVGRGEPVGVGGGVA